jgi:hypothetical protein
MQKVITDIPPTNVPGLLFNKYFFQTSLLPKIPVFPDLKDFVLITQVAIRIIRIIILPFTKEVWAHSQGEELL